jgi:hypothetical protein
MTYKLCDDAAALLAASRHAFGALSAESRLAPDQSGLYGWWFKSPLGDAPLEGAFACGGFRLLYVGVAPERRADSARPSRRTLRLRLRDHTRGTIARSTLRRSLACLLAPTLELKFGRTRSDKPALLSGGEARLSAWMAASASVGWVCAAKPWVVEEDLIARGPPLPLNIKGSTHPFAAELRRRRSRLAHGLKPGV